MMNLVLFVDASVAVKWFVPEIHAADAVRLQDPARSLHVPTLFDAEMGKIFWKETRRGELTTIDASEMVGRISSFPIRRHDVRGILSSAFNLACVAGRTVYDCLYFALAIHLDGRLVTADQRPVEHAASRPRPLDRGRAVTADWPVKIRSPVARSPLVRHRF